MFEREWSVIQTKLQSVQHSRTKPSLISLIKRPTVYKPSIILIILLFFQQACCIYPLSAYTLHVLPVLGKSQGEEFKYRIFVIFSGARLLIAIGTTIFLTRFNQKQLLSISYVGMLVFSLILVGFQIFVKTTDLHENLWYDWIMIISFVFYTASGCVGALGIPWTIIFELLPTEVRGTLGPYFVAVGYVIMSAFLKSFFTLYATIGTIYLFIMIALVSLAGTVFIHFYIPETRGQTLYDIENRFANKK